MSETTLMLNNIFSVLTLASNLFLLAIIVALFNRKPESWGSKFLNVLRRYSYELAFVFSLGAVTGSLIYSEYIGFEPCLLCWLQRIFLFPITLILCIALFKRERVVNDYVVILSIFGGLIALYHSFTQLGGPSLTSCTEVGGDCSIVYFLKFGYITIPFMAFSVFAIISALMLVGKNSKVVV